MLFRMRFIVGFIFQIFKANAKVLSQKYATGTSFQIHHSLFILSSNTIKSKALTYLLYGAESFLRS